VAEHEEARDFVRFVNNVVISLRRTLEVPYQAQLRQGSDGAASLREILRDLESARLVMSPAKMISSQRGITASSRYLAAFSNELTQITKNPEYIPILRAIKFRKLEFLPPNNEPLQFKKFGEDQSAFEVILSLIGLLADFSNPLGTEESQRDLFHLRSILPSQKIAPAQFAIENERITIKKKPSKADASDLSNIESAKSELQRNGEKIIRELRQSNCDRRLLDNVEYLQAQLIDSADAIKIGITNLGCEIMCTAFDHELPSAVSSMLKAHTRGIQLFVGQFPEWNKFLENAASAQLESSDVTQLRAAAEDVIEKLRARPDVVDPEVPRTLSYLTQLLENPSASGKRAAFAFLRSMENLISLIFQYGTEFGQKTVSKSIEAASTAASKIVVITLLTLALGSATAIGPIASKVPEMNWLQTASEIVKKQLKKMSAE
jgi:hypothetical protein